MKTLKYFSAIIVLILSIVFMLPVSALADDIFTTGGTVEPEKDIYYVGDTVEITDYFRNKGTISATSVSVEYYHRLDGANSVYSGSPISFGTIAGGASESHSYTYTFKESDIGEYRIGSKITYMLSGGGPYKEYSTGHDFTVMPAPDPTATPTASATATPAVTPTPTPEPTASPSPEPTASPTPTAAPEEDETTAAPTPIPTLNPTPEPDIPEGPGIGEELASIFKENKVLSISIIVLAASLTALIILIIIMAPKKR